MMDTGPPLLTTLFLAQLPSSISTLGNEGAQWGGKGGQGGELVGKPRSLLVP